MELAALHRRVADAEAAAATAAAAAAAASAAQRVVLVEVPVERVVEREVRVPESPCPDQGPAGPAGTPDRREPAATPSPCRGVC